MKKILIPAAICCLLLAGTAGASLLGIAPFPSSALPNVAFSNGTTTYNPGTGAFDSTASASFISFTSGNLQFITGGSVAIHITVKNDGTVDLTKATTTDLVVTGSVGTYGTPLLTGTIVAFGYLDMGGTNPDLFDFRFHVTGGSLAPLFVHQDIGVAISSERSSFVDFAGAFSGGSKGNVAPISMQCGAIGDYVWNDANGNGIQDSNEVGINTVTVNLYAGSTATGTPIATTTTGNNPHGGQGYYQFSNVCAGTYTVQVDETTLPPGLVPSPSTAPGSTTANDSNGSPAVVTLPYNGASDETIDFGYYQCGGQIGDYVWHDLNRDGIQNDAGAGLDGVTVDLFDINGNTVGTTTTSGGGMYLFSGLCGGTYTVQVDESTLPPGFTPTTPNAPGSTTANDSNGSPASVTLVGDFAQDLTIDFGYVNACTGAIGDFVWRDSNQNGIQDTNEPGIPSVVLYLMDSTGTIQLDSRTTDANGLYLFTGVCAGTYKVVVDASTLPAGYTPTTSFAGGDTLVDSNGSPASVTLPTDSSSDLTIDFGYIAPCTGAIGDFVWNDVNGNGVQDAGEPGIPGVTLHLLDSSNSVLQTTTTDGNGLYLFGGLCPGEYKVEAVPPANANASPTGQGSTLTDSNPNPSTVLLPADNSTDLSIDFGFYYTPAIKIVKLTNGTDNDFPPGLHVTAGSTVIWSYIVTNTGYVPLTSVAVTDNMGVTVTCPKSTLAVGEQMTCTASGIAISGQYSNIGTVTGLSPTGQPVTDSNPDNYFGETPTPRLELTKTANPTTAPAGSPITYTYTVKNAGEVTLTNILVTDDNGTPTFAGDDFTVCTIPSLAAGASQSCSVTVIPPVILSATLTSGPTVPAGTLFITQLSNGDVKVVYRQDFGVNDNTYGTGSIGWPASKPHTFSDLVGSDHVEFRFTDTKGNVVLDFYQDYISTTTDTTHFPSGYASLCASGGDGKMVSGSITNILSCSTTLAEDLNNPLNVPKKATLIVNSPTSLSGTNVVVNMTAAPGGWDYIDGYTVVVSHLAFGTNGFGGVTIPDQHNSPSKTGQNQVVPCAQAQTVVNTASGQATWSGGTLTAGATASVAVTATCGGGTSSGALAVTAKKLDRSEVQITLKNTTTAAAVLSELKLTWPSATNGKLKQVKMGANVIYNTALGGGTADITTWLLTPAARSIPKGGTLILHLVFEHPVDKTAAHYTGSVLFTGFPSLTILP